MHRMLHVAGGTGRRRKTLLWYQTAPRENGADGVSLSRGSHAEAVYLEKRSARGALMAGARSYARRYPPVRSHEPGLRVAPWAAAVRIVLKEARAVAREGGWMDGWHMHASG